MAKIINFLLDKSLLKLNLRFRVGFLRQKTPDFQSLKTVIWGTNSSSNKQSVPKTIWLYWHDEVITSETVNLCINQIKALHLDYRIHLINSKNLRDWLPDFPNISSTLPLANIADLIRLMLLDKYGGIYMDASVFVFKKIDWILDTINKDSSEAFLYYTDENTIDKSYPVLENWCIAAIQSSQFITDWKNEYLNCLQSSDLENYYSEQNGSGKPFVLKLDPNYHKCYFSCQSVMHYSQYYKLSLGRAEDDGFLYSLKIKDKWSDISMSEILLMNEKPIKMSNMVKIVNDSRRRLDQYIKIGFYKKNTIFGSLIETKKVGKQM